ncbi:MAG: response regulator [Candidatus Heimdallarchaeota archaeon]
MITFLKKKEFGDNEANKKEASIVVDLKVLIIDNDETIRKKIINHLSKKNYLVLQAANGSTAIDLVEKNQINLVLIELAMPDISGVALIEKINEISPSTEFILITKNLPHKDMLYLAELNLKFAYLEKPVDFKKLNASIEKINKSKEEFFEMQSTLNDMFKSYNQLEFLMTILFNDYESSTETLGKALEDLSLDKLTKQQTKKINTIKQVFYGNNRLITSYNNLRSASDISHNEFSKQDIVVIMQQILDDMKLNNICDIKLPNDFRPGEFFVKGTSDGIKVLFYEILKSLTIPETKLCKSLVIEIKKTDENLPNAIEIGIKTILHKIKDVYQDSMLDPSTYQYGFTYFVVRNLVEIFDGKLLLSDAKKGGLTETTMVIVIPQY